jgi:hypothetical protein
MCTRRPNSDSDSRQLHPTQGSRVGIHDSVIPTDACGNGTQRRLKTGRPGSALPGVAGSPVWVSGKLTRTLSVLFHHHHHFLMRTSFHPPNTNAFLRLNFRGIIDPNNRARPRGLARGWRGARKLHAGPRGDGAGWRENLARVRAGPRGDGAGHVNSAPGWRGMARKFWRGFARGWRGAARGT